MAFGYSSGGKSEGGQAMRIQHLSGLKNIAAQRGAYTHLISRTLLLLILSAAHQVELAGKALPQPCQAQGAALQAQESQTAAPNKTEPVSPPSRQDRSALTLPKALLGHWVAEDGKTHMYYSEDYYISVYSGKFYPAKYTLEEINESERTMRVRIKTLHSRILTFSADKNDFVDIAEVAGVRATAEQAIRWKYVDDRRKPSLETLQSTQGDEPLVEAVTVEAVTVEEAPRPELS
jgi:hypothetical protein